MVPVPVSLLKSNENDLFVWKELREHRTGNFDSSVQTWISQMGAKR